MKSRFLWLLILSSFTSPVVSQAETLWNEGLVVSREEDEIHFSWFGRSGYAYMLETSLTLHTWTQIPHQIFLEQGFDETIVWSTIPSDDRFFLRVRGEFLDGPTAWPQSGLETCKGSPYRIILYGSDSEGLPLTFSIVEPPDPATGSLSSITQINDYSADVWFTPASDYCGGTNFSFRVNNGTFYSQPATVSLVVGRKPSASGNTWQTCKGVPVAVTLNGWDSCNQSLTYEILEGPQNGQLTGNAPNLTYVPDAAFCGTDVFVFQTQSDCFDSLPATVTIHVGNPYPSAYCQDVLTGTGQPVTLDLCGFDTCGDGLTFVVESGPGNGVLSSITPISGTCATVTYTPNPGFEGVDTFWFTANNCGFSSSWQQATIRVVPAPALTVECLPRSIVLEWTLPEWLHYGNIKEFNIYRCTVSSGTCIPSTLYATLDDYVLVNNPASWRFVDTDVEPGTVYCYRVAFTRQSNCNSQVIYESPFSATVCSTPCCPDPQEPFWTDYGGTAQELAEWIVGPGFTVSNATYTGASVAKGTFGNGFSANFPIDRGVILSTGDIALAKGPNDKSDITKNNQNAGDADLNSLVSGLQTRDAAILEFDITSATATTVEIEYIFASEEYPEWIQQYNDIMAIFIDGGNVALVPGTSLPIAVNTINGGHDAAPPVSASNPQFYVDNSDPSHSALPPYAASAPVYNIQYDGTTVALTTTPFSVYANTTYRIKIAIADASDYEWDSAVFIKAHVPCP
jgi:hypothetical protein